MRIEAFRRGSRLVKIKEGQSTSFDDAPSVAESEVSDLDNLDSELQLQHSQPRLPLQWVFHGLTLWVHCEEHDQDLTKAIEDHAKFHGTERIPYPHATAIYGMEHLSDQEALARFQKVAEAFPDGWPTSFDSPSSVKCDLAVEGRPGQVCSISWAELTMKTNEQHEAAIDTLHEIFGVERKAGQLWTPHLSLAYDNPEDTVLSLADTISYVAQNPSLMQPRRVQAVSLWSMKGKMADWKCMDRIDFF